MFQHGSLHVKRRCGLILSQLVDNFIPPHGGVNGPQLLREVVEPQLFGHAGPSLNGRGTAGGPAREAPGHARNHRKLQELFKALGRPVIGSNLPDQHRAVSGIEALAVLHLEIPHSVQKQGLSCLAVEGLGRDDDVAWVVVREEARPFIDAPQTRQVGPVQQHHKPIRQLQKLLDQQHRQLHQLRALLPNTTLIDPELHPLPLLVISEEIQGKILRDDAQLRGLDICVVAGVAHELCPPLRDAPAVAGEAQRGLAGNDAVVSVPAEGPIEILVQPLVRIPESLRSLGESVHVRPRRRHLVRRDPTEDTAGHM
mmetsp:Transcript_9143/g.19695  ORF Transcript_9143/g.19695 Transcript_9143/m.19695 type:complete len:312 (+) Transcript_9143:405-1340(+)